MSRSGLVLPARQRSTQSTYSEDATTLPAFGRGIHFRSRDEHVDVELDQSGTTPTTLSEADNEHDSLFSGESDTGDDMSNQPPYFDHQAGVDDLQHIEPSLNSFESGTSPQTFRYSDPASAATQTSDVLDLHRLVAAAHSVAEREQYQRGQDGRVSGASKRRQHGDVVKTSKRRRTSGKPLNGDHGRLQDLPADSIMTPSPTRKLPSSVLYRPVSSQTKRSTRPAMHTLFNSFKLPETRFLQLQSAAKDFMLDPQFPERRTLVGARGGGDTRKVKVELARTVRRFLDEGAGEEFFGISTKVASDSETVEASDPFSHPRRGQGSGTEAEPDTPANDAPADIGGGDARTADVHDKPSVTDDPITKDNDENTAGGHSSLLWPRDRDRITDACMPLLRRVVTNERQRQYALETRQAMKDKTAASQEAPIAIKIYGMTLGHQEKAAQTGPVIGQIPALSGDTESDGKDQWETILDLLGPESRTKNIHIQTSDGLVKVHDHESCRSAVERVLMAPWLDRTVRVVVDDIVETNGGTGVAA